uniref:Amine oxidase domain-containing protein n=1 Tax=Oryza glumipatula TaxID=40148 RepID=A0A0D9ZE04_9ORYZ
MSAAAAAAAASAANVAVIGGGISGAVCASLLAAHGVAVTLFDSGRGAGGRMAQRREVMEDGTELRFDHGAPYFTVSNDEVARVVSGWEARGLVAEWKAMFACFDREAGKFTDFEKEGTIKKYVGVPGMNSICKSLCLEDGVVAKFGVTIGRMDWIQDRSSWLLASLDGRDLGHFDYVVATDKNIASPRFSGLTGRPPPLDLSLLPQLSMMIQDIPVRPCFALMLAFSEPLTKVPVQGFSFSNSDYLSWAFCDSSKPGRAHVLLNSQSWVLHSTAEYASKVINNIGPRKPSADALAKVAEELLKEFQATGLNIPQPIFMKAHRWGSAFPAIAISGDDKCVWDKSMKLAICGDFCTSPSVEGAVLSGMRGASKILGISSVPHTT